MAATLDPSRRVVTLPEFRSHRFAAGELPEETAELLRDRYQEYVALQPPFFTGAGWEVKALGCVGYLPVTPQLAFSLQPKVPIRNLLGMWEVAWRLDAAWFPSLYAAQTLAECYEHLAAILAQRTLERCRQGVQRAYVPDEDDLPYVRGQLDCGPLMRQPWRAQLRCRYEEHTADVEDNQLILWTLHCILRSGLCREDHARPQVRAAWRALHQYSSLRPFGAAACANRVYHRLNAGYAPLHALCRFFLEHSGPTHQAGERQMLPFLLQMDRLFETFVAQWLRRRLAGRYEVAVQQAYALGGSNSFQADIVLSDPQTRQPRWVLDTKYKRNPVPSAADIAQVVAYATAFGAPEAVLVYPSAQGVVPPMQVGGVRVRTLSFSLDGDLEGAGEEFVQALVRG